MTWVKLDDHFADHPKVMALGRDRMAGLGLWVAAACYCARYLTDGFVPTQAARNFGSDRILGRLVEVGLVTPCEGGYRLHDWLEYNPSREKVMAERAAAKDRMFARRSPEVQANTTRTNGEVRRKFSDPVPVPGPIPVSEVLTNVTNGAEPWIEPTDIYKERTRRKSLSQKERDWIEDLHARFSRREVVAAMAATAPGPDFLRRVDTYLEGRA